MHTARRGSSVIELSGPVSIRKGGELIGQGGVTNSGVSRPNPQGANTVSSELEFHYGNSHLKDFGLVRKTNKLEVKLFCQVSKSAKSLQALYVPLRIGKHCQSAALSGDEPKITFSPESAKRSTNTHFQV